MIVHQRVTAPFTRTVMGAEVTFRPIDRALVRRARRIALRALGRDEHGPEPAEEDLAVQLEDLGDALSEAMIREGVIGWDGPVQQLEDGGTAPLAFSAEALDLALADPVTFDAFDAAYVFPYATREREKNGSAASPSGTGEAATRDSDTASRAATRKRRDGARPAPTGPSGSRRKTRKASGTS